MGKMVEFNSHTVDVTTFHNALAVWGTTHFRPFPWRFTQDPYQILVAEIMLHRTQARQVVPVYNKFLKRYPELTDLAQATREELYDVLHSLGLRWRIDLIHEMVDILINKYGSRIPEEKEKLLSLPGVGDYIASAVRCFAWNYQEALVDTNTVRVIARLFGLAIKDSLRRNSRFQRLMTFLVDCKNPRVYNYALLDLADAVCMRRRAPDCDGCPVQGVCSHGRYKR